MKYVKRTLAALVLALAVLYAGDDFSVRFHIPSGRNPFGTVQIKRYYAIPQKNHKTEFYLGDPETQTCVHSLFPHLGYNPCWYVERKRLQRIDE
jgi:hypothetical protein